MDQFMIDPMYEDNIPAKTDLSPKVSLVKANENKIHFDHEKLDKLAQKITHEVARLKIKLKDDSANAYSHTVHATLETYLPKIHQNYIETPAHLREMEYKNQKSVYEMTLSQLEKLHSDLIEVDMNIDKTILAEQHKNSKIFDKFLKEKEL